MLTAIKTTIRRAASAAWAALDGSGVFSAPGAVVVHYGRPSNQLAVRRAVATSVAALSKAGIDVGPLLVVIHPGATFDVGGAAVRRLALRYERLGLTVVHVAGRAGATADLVAEAVVALAPRTSAPAAEVRQRVDLDEALEAARD